MPRFIAFLRAINVGGRNVKMDRLRALWAELNFDGVETFIASGNIIFVAQSANVVALKKRIEAHLAKSLGYEVHTFLRTDAELAAVARHQPFSPAQLKNARAVYIAFLEAPLSAAHQKTLAGFRTEIDEFHFNKREVYWLCRKSQSESKFSNAVFERALKLRATFRGVKTVVKLAAKYRPMEIG